MPPNPWCEQLDIAVPRLEAVKDHREANTFSLLLVALLEHGGPMTLREVAARFDEAGVAPFEAALLSLQRCKPGRAPVHRDGERYHLDPYDDDLDLWAFRLGLRPPKIPRLSVVPPPPPPRPNANTPLTVAELDLAWKDANIRAWSAQRLALAVLDAHDGPMRPDEVVAFMAARTRWHLLRSDMPTFARRGSAIEVLPDGRWSIGHDAAWDVMTVRDAVRDRLDAARQRASTRTDPAVVKASLLAHERQRAAHAQELAGLRRVLLHAFPSKRPLAVALLDVGRRELTTLIDTELATLPERLAVYDVIGAVDVRALLDSLGFDPGPRRLAELGPPQKTKQLNKRGRTLKITIEMLIQGSCGISRPFGDPDKLAVDLAHGRETKVRRRLEASVKALYALYQYGRLHGGVRLRWGFLDDLIPVPWVHRDELGLLDLERTALETGKPLEVVVGNAPGWADPWARAELAFVEKHGWHTWLVDPEGERIDERGIQLARLAEELP